jgi:hypothetical protein
MDTQRQTPATLRAEARLLATAGLLVLGVAFPLTLLLVAEQLEETATSPFLPIAIGAPPIMLGYLACHFASRRIVKATMLEG